MEPSKIWQSSSDTTSERPLSTSNSVPSSLNMIPSISIQAPADMPIDHARTLPESNEERSHFSFGKRSFNFGSSSSSSRKASSKEWSGVVCAPGKPRQSRRPTGELDEGEESDSESVANHPTEHEDEPAPVQSRLRSCRSSKASSSGMSGLRTSLSLGFSQRVSELAQSLSFRGSFSKGDRRSRLSSKSSVTSKSSSKSDPEEVYESQGTASNPLGFLGKHKDKHGRNSNLLLARIAQATGSFVKPAFLKKEEQDFRTTLTKTNCADIFHIRADFASWQEQQAQLQNMLQPHGSSTWRLSLLSPVGIRYDKVMVFLTMLTLIYAPLQLAVESLCSRHERGIFALLKALHLVCTLVYAILALVFRFAFSAVDVPFGVELFNVKDIFALVLKEKCFWLDVLSALSLPFETYHMTVEASHPTWIQVLIAILALSRSWRFVCRGLRVDTRGEAWRSRLYVELVAKFGSLLLLFHFFACFWALVSNIERNSNVSSWLDDRRDGCGRLYLESLYFMITTATSVGFGDTVPANGFERVVCVIMMITGQMIMAEIFAHMNWVTSVVNFDRARHIRKVTKTCASLNSLQVPWSIANRVLAFIDYTGITRKDLAVKSHLEDLSYPLRTEILLTMYYDLVIACPFFQDQSFDVILFVMHSLNDQAYLPGDVIFKSSSVARELFFIRSGEVALVTKLVNLKSLDSKAKMLKSGDYFGETCMLMGTRYNVNAMTTCYCLLSILSQDGIQGLEKRFPNGFLMLVKSAQEVCHTRSALTWSRVFEVLHDRFETTEEAFQWLRSGETHNGINASQFTDGLCKLGMKRFDAQVLWAQTPDKIQGGFMTHEDFCEIGAECMAKQASMRSLTDDSPMNGVASTKEAQEPKSQVGGKAKLMRLATWGSMAVSRMRRKSSNSLASGEMQRTASNGGLSRCNTFDFENHYKAERKDSLSLDKVLKTQGVGRLSLLSAYGLFYQRFLRQLAAIMVLLAPCQVCFEAACKEDERGLAMVLKVVLLICSTLYSILALVGRFVFAVVNMQKGTELHEFKDVVSNAFRSWQFWLDVIAAFSVPFEIVQLSMEPTSPSWSDCIILLTLLRSWRLFVVIVRLHARVNITMEIGWLFVFLLLQIHIVACAWGLLGIVQWQARIRGEDVENNWIEHAIARKHLPSDSGCVELYISSLYFASATFSSVGYGDIYAVNNSEYVVVVMMMLFSQVVIAQVFAMLNWTTYTGRQIHAEHVSKVCYISAALHDLQIPKVLRQRVLAVTDYAQTCQRQKPILPLLKELPPPLQLMVRSALYSGLVQGCPFFHNMGQDATDLVIRSLVDRAYLPNDFIFSEGDLGDDMYFIRTGEVSLIKASHEFSRLSTLNFSDEVLRLKPGAYFGELAALMGGARRKLTAVSYGYSILSLLSADAFKTLEQDHPVPFVKLVRNAQEMLKAQQKPSYTWDQISRMVAARGMSIEQTFEWIQAGKGVVDHISIASFTDAMRKLGVDRFSAHALWIEADLENDGFLTYEEFEKNMRSLQGMLLLPESPARSASSTSQKRRKLSALPVFRQPKMVSIVAPLASSGSIASSPILNSASMTSEESKDSPEAVERPPLYESQTCRADDNKQAGPRLTLSEVRRSIKNAKKLEADGTMFGLRMYVEESEQKTQLDRMLYTSQERSRFSIVGRAGRIYLRCLAVLASVTCVYVPLQLAIEPAADDEERNYIQTLKNLHASFSLLYTLVAIPGRLCFTVADLSQCVELSQLRNVVNCMLKSKGFWLDLAATISIPFECIHLGEEESSPTISQYLMCFALLRSWRILKPEATMNHGHRSLYREIVFLPVVLVMEIHLMACFWAYLGLAEYRDGGTWWLQSLGMEMTQTCVSLYVQAVYFIGFTITGVGYGDIVPVNAQERIIAVLVMILGQMSIAELFAQITWVTQIYNCIRAEQASKTLRLTDALKQLRLADDFQKRVIAYTDYCHLYMKEAAVRVHFEDLSPPLLDELRLVVNFELVVHCPFFQDEPVTVVRLLVNLLKEQAYLPQDFIFRTGGHASEMYLIRTGTVSMCTNTSPTSMNTNDFEEVASLSSGDHFGEVGLLTGSPHRLNALAMTYLNLSFLSSEDFETLDGQCPGFSLTFVKSAKAFIPDLYSHLSWAELAKQIVDKFGDPFAAFSWMCRDESETNTMTLEAFKKGLEFLGHSRYAALCFWSSCRKKHSSTMDAQIFNALVNQHLDAAEVEKYRRMKDSRGSVTGSCNSLECITEDHAESATPGTIQESGHAEIGRGLDQTHSAVEMLPAVRQTSSNDVTNMHCSETPSIEHVSESCSTPASPRSATILKLPEDLQRHAEEENEGENKDSVEMPAHSLVDGKIIDDGCLQEPAVKNDETSNLMEESAIDGEKTNLGDAASAPPVCIRNDEGSAEENPQGQSAVVPVSVISDSPKLEVADDSPTKIDDSSKQGSQSMEGALSSLNGLGMVGTGECLSERFSYSLDNQLTAPSDGSVDSNNLLVADLSSRMSSVSTNTASTTRSSVCSSRVTKDKHRDRGNGLMLFGANNNSHNGALQQPSSAAPSASPSLLLPLSLHADHTSIRCSNTSSWAMNLSTQSAHSAHGTGNSRFRISPQAKENVHGVRGSILHSSVHMLSRLLQGSRASSSVTPVFESSDQQSSSAGQQSTTSKRSHLSGKRSSNASLRSSVGIFTHLFNFDGLLSEKVEDHGNKYNGISCTEYEIHVRAEESSENQKRNLAHMLVMYGDVGRVSIASRSGIVYQKFLRWLSLCVIMLTALRLAWPRICSEDGLALMVDCLYYSSSSLYVIFAIPIRLLFTVIDVRKGQEFYDFSVVLWTLMRSKGMWLDAISSAVFMMECIGAIFFPDPHEVWRLAVGFFRSLCGWHAFRPIIRVRTMHLSLFATITNLLLVLLMVVHLMACAWAYLATVESDVGVRQWTSTDEHLSRCFGLYASSFYFIGYSSTATGYGDILPANEFEQMIAVAVMITGTFLIAQICASLNWATKTHNFRRAQHVSKVSQIAAALETLGTHSALSSRVFALLEYTALRHREAEIRQHLHDFSPPLQLEFRISRYDGLLRRCPLFFNQPREVLQLFIHELHDHVFLPSDYIFWEGDVPTQLFFVRIGQVATFRVQDVQNGESEGSIPQKRKSTDSMESDGNHLQRFYAGDHFGEVPVLTGQFHSVSAKALIYCILGTLSQEVFEVILKAYPEAYLNLLQGVLYTSQTISSITWKQLSTKLIQRFGDRDTAFSAMLPKSGPKVESSVIPISRFLSTLAKIGVEKMDAQSLWLSIDFPDGEDKTCLTYSQFCENISAEVNGAKKKRKSQRARTSPREDESKKQPETLDVS